MIRYHLFAKFHLSQQVYHFIAAFTANGGIDIDVSHNWLTHCLMPLDI